MCEPLREGLKGGGRFIRFTDREGGEEGDEEDKDEEWDVTISNLFLHEFQFSNISLIFQRIHRIVIYNKLEEEDFLRK